MAELDDLKAFTAEKYTAGGGKKKKVIEKIMSCTTMKELLTLRRKLGMMEWNNK